MVRETFCTEIDLGARYFEPKVVGVVIVSIIRGVVSGEHWQRMLARLLAARGDAWVVLLLLVLIPIVSESPAFIISSCSCCRLKIRLGDAHCGAMKEDWPISGDGLRLLKEWLSVTVRTLEYPGVVSWEVQNSLTLDLCCLESPIPPR